MFGQHRISRRECLKLGAVAAWGLFAAACSPQVSEETAKPSGTTEEVASGSEAAPADTEGKTLTAEELLGPGSLPGSPEHPKGFRTVLPALPSGMPVSPSVVITAGRPACGATTFAEGEDIENNPFTRMVRDALGIEWKAAFTHSDPADAEAKFNLALASGTLPDVCTGMPTTVFEQALAADALEDVTDTWESAASERWLKEPADREGSTAWAFLRVNGRKYGMPVCQHLAENEAIMWIRQDWLDQLDLAVPQTLEEVRETALAFKGADLGQGAPGTTIGLLASNLFTTWFGSLDPVFGAFGVIPEFWLLYDDSLEYASTRPEMRDALSLLRDWYADGVIESDFFTLTQVDAAKYVSGNRCGLMLSEYYCARWGLPESLQNDPDAKWVYAEIPEGVAGRNKAWKNPWLETPVTFRKGFEHADKVIQQTNWLMELQSDPSRRWHGWEGPGWSYTIENDTYMKTTMLDHKWAYGHMVGASGCNMDPLQQYNIFAWQEENWSDLPEQEWDAYQRAYHTDPTGTEKLYRGASMFAVESSEKYALHNRFVAPPTPTMVERKADLLDLERETLFSIITGDKPLEEFDSFVETHEQMGGGRIAEEVNDWWATRM